MPRVRPPPPGKLFLAALSWRGLSGGARGRGRDPWGQRRLRVEGPGARESPSFLPAQLFRLCLPSWAQDTVFCLIEAVVEGAPGEEGRGGNCRKTGEGKRVSCLRSR